MSSLKNHVAKLNYSAIPEELEENIQDSDPNHGHRFESLYPSAALNRDSRSPSLRDMENRRNNLKKRIAEVNQNIRSNVPIKSS